MKKYPRVNWKQISNDKKKKFDRIEEIVSSYLRLECEGNYKVLSYNIAFLVVTDNLEEIIK